MNKLKLIFCSSRRKRFTSDEEHEYIHKHQLTERGAGRPITSNEYVMEDKSARKESTSSGESGPMYDNPDPSYDKTQGAYVNCATSEASLPTYDNPGATGSYDMSQGVHVDINVSITQRNATQHNATQRNIEHDSHSTEKS